MKKFQFSQNETPMKGFQRAEKGQFSHMIFSKNENRPKIVSNQKSDFRTPPKVDIGEQLLIISYGQKMNGTWKSCVFTRPH